jgi:hypothetical protein
MVGLLWTEELDDCGQQPGHEDERVLHTGEDCAR